MGKVKIDFSTECTPEAKQALAARNGGISGHAAVKEHLLEVALAAVDGLLLDLHAEGVKANKEARLADLLAQEKKIAEEKAKLGVVATE